MNGLDVYFRQYKGNAIGSMFFQGKKGGAGCCQVTLINHLSGNLSSIGRPDCRIFLVRTCSIQGRFGLLNPMSRSRHHGLGLGKRCFCLAVAGFYFIEFLFGCRVFFHKLQVSMIRRGRKLGTGPIRLQGAIYDANGTRVQDVKLRLLDRGPAAVADAESLVTQFRPKGLPPGDYMLRVTIDHPDTGPTMSADTPFTLGD